MDSLRHVRRFLHLQRLLLSWFLILLIETELSNILDFRSLPCPCPDPRVSYKVNWLAQVFCSLALKIWEDGDCTTFVGKLFLCLWLSIEKKSYVWSDLISIYALFFFVAYTIVKSLDQFCGHQQAVISFPASSPGWTKPSTLYISSQRTNEQAPTILVTSAGHPELLLLMVGLPVFRSSPVRLLASSPLIAPYQLFTFTLISLHSGNIKQNSLCQKPLANQSWHIVSQGSVRLGHCIAFSRGLNAKGKSYSRLQNFFSHWKAKACHITCTSTLFPRPCHIIEKFFQRSNVSKLASLKFNSMLPSAEYHKRVAV